MGKKNRGKKYADRKIIQSQLSRRTVLVEAGRRTVSRSQHSKATLDSLPTIDGEAKCQQDYFFSVSQHTGESRVYLQNTDLDHYTDELQKPEDQRSIFHSQPLLYFLEEWMKIKLFIPFSLYDIPRNERLKTQEPQHLCL